MTSFRLALAAVAAALVSGEARAYEATYHPSCSITHRGRPTVRFARCTVVSSSSQGAWAYDVTTPDGRRFQIESGVVHYTMRAHPTREAN